jgi:hypothetical protein
MGTLGMQAVTSDLLLVEFSGMLVRCKFRKTFLQAALSS